VEIEINLVLVLFPPSQQTCTCDPGHRTFLCKQFNIATERCILVAMLGYKIRMELENEEN
jgi:hypothetical protein